jgi:leucyl aminopeptidase (aminopeptidase T)
LQITDKDNVAINLYPHNLSLAEEVAEECFRNGADVIMSLYTDRFLAANYNYLTEERLREPSDFCRGLTEKSTAEIFMSATYDPTILRTIEPKKLAADSEGENTAHFPLSKERKVRTLSIGLALVTKPRAKVYGFNFAKWSRMMQASTSVDYQKLAKTGRVLMGSLKDAQTIEVTGPQSTKLSFDVSGRKWYLSDGIVDEEDIRNEDLNDQLPAGSLTVAPLEESAQGQITFNAGTPVMGRQVKGLQLTFKNGKVTGFKGNTSTAAVKKNWEAGTGDKDNIGLFGIGFNPKAETGYTVNNVAFGAVSIGIGGNEFLGGKNKPGFFHFDTITGATVKADGRIILRNGKFV